MDVWYYMHGFLWPVWSSQDPQNWTNDISAYIWEMFAMTKEEFDEKWGAYPLILERRDALVDIFERNNVRVY